MCFIHKQPLILTFSLLAAYAPQYPDAGYPPQQEAYPPQAAYPSQPAYAPQPGYPPQQAGYAPYPQGAYPQQQGQLVTGMFSVLYTYSHPFIGS